jgi:serine phosphatase RsbU (regulator of sigma subunit)
VLTTDGIIEARAGDEMFGEERQVETVVRLASGSAQSIAQGIYQSAREFARGALHDDAALAVVRRTV